MRIDIHSNDKLGITHSIFTVLASAKINILATEVEKFHTYIHMDTDASQFSQVKPKLLAISGVLNVEPIDWLPGEYRQKHLNVLMQRLPDPTLDIDHKGKILLATDSAAQICAMTVKELEGLNIKDFIAEPLTELLQVEYSTIEVNFNNKPFQADITPVMDKQKIRGAILILRSPERIGQQISAVQQNNEADINDMIGQSTAIKTVMDKCRRFGQLDMPVLITGETGTGKELLAQALHQQSADADAPFLAVNCATLPENLLESELFGYAPGAFTGAGRSGKPGLFELANGGTVFLDEIGEMSPYLQAKLLRFLQSYTFRRVGGTKELKVKVRLISATHRDLEQMAQQGSFREDLFYRLNVLNIEIPPLRVRADDVKLLIEHFVTRAAEQVAIERPTISQNAIEKLCNYHWPGNVRQLENLLFRTIALLDSPILEAEQIQLPNRHTAELTDKNLNDNSSEQRIESWQSAQKAFECQLLKQLYPQYRSTRKLAERLKVSHNKIAMKLKEHGIKS